MLTAGVDLAAEPVNTAVAVLRWSPGGCQIDSLTVDVDDDQVLATIRAAEKVGLDCPIGWPDAFVEFVVAHHDGKLAVPTGALDKT